MKKLLTMLLLTPSIVMAHPGGAHTHPEEMAAGLMLLVAVACAYLLWKKNK